MDNIEVAARLLEVVPKTMRMVRDYMREAGDQTLTIPQYRVLAKICRDGTSMNRDLAEWMGVSEPTMSNLVDRLVARGFVLKAIDPKGPDRRQSAIRATRSGATRSAEIRQKATLAFAAQLARLSDDEKKQLMAGLAVLGLVNQFGIEARIKRQLAPPPSERRTKSKARARKRSSA